MNLKFMEGLLVECKRLSVHLQDISRDFVVRRQANIRITILTMKITAAIILLGALHISAAGWGQRISFSGANVPLSTVFNAITDQTGYGVFMSHATLEAAKPVSMNLKNATLDEILVKCFSYQPWKLGYTITGHTISIVKNEPSAVETLAFSEPPVVVGTVRSEDGTPLAGATIEIKQLNKKELTNEKGEFIFEKMPNGKYRIEISYIGYDTYVADINVENQQVRFFANLKQSLNKLDQVQIIAYGQTTQRLSTGDVTTIKAEEIGKQPVNNPLLALEGRVPGLLITQNNGLSGGGVTVQIRGRNSIGQGRDPLYVVDGVPYSSNLFSSSSSPGLGGILGNGINPLNFINPSDIESISVLKDADATAIYGSRAANGVILITTKKGRIGENRITANVTAGAGKITRKTKLLNTSQYLEMRKEAFKNDNLTPTVTNAPDLLTYSQNTTQDWQKFMIGGTSRYTDAEISTSGGSLNTQYLIGGGYHRETTVFPGTWCDQKGSLHFNITSSSQNQKFRISLSENVLVDNNQLPNQDFSGFILLAPNSPYPTKPDGSLDWINYPSSNPLSAKYPSYNARTNNFLGNAILSYALLPGLEIRTSIGYNNVQLNENFKNPVISINPAFHVTTGSASFNNNNLKSWIVEPQLNYQTKISNGRVNVLLGATVQKRLTEGQVVSGTGYSDDALLGSLAAATTITKGTSIFEDYRYNSFFGRVGYNWEDKYLFNVTARRDGSSRFGPGRQFGDFGAIGIGWIFSKEVFTSKIAPWLSYGKLRSSYGTSGNEPSFSYQYVELYNFNTAANLYGGGAGVYPTSLPSPDFSWEVNKKLEIGIELGLFKDRILVSANYYRNRSNNELLGYALPSITGFTSITTNLPATVQNKGWEATLNTNNIKTNEFNWSSGFNFTSLHNALLTFPMIPNVSSAAYGLGQPITSLAVYHSAGVDQATGIYQFYDSKGKPTFTPSSLTDKTIRVNTIPAFYGGLQNSFRYKSLQLDIDLQYQKQIGKNDLYASQSPGFFAPGASSNQPLEIINRWGKAGDIKPFQKFSTSRLSSFNTVQSSDLAYTDASFIRVKNISFSYDLTKRALSGTAMNVRLYIRAQNLLTITKYKGTDPESQTLAILPPLRVIVGGFQITL